MFIITQMHGLGWGKLTRWIIGLGYILSALGVYNWKGWGYLNEVIRIPFIEYLVALLMAGLVALGIWIADRFKRQPVALENPAAD
jgi:hypothetical protein